MIGMPQGEPATELVVDRRHEARCIETRIGRSILGVSFVRAEADRDDMIARAVRIFDGFTFRGVTLEASDFEKEMPSLAMRHAAASISLSKAL